MVKMSRNAVPRIDRSVDSEREQADYCSDKLIFQEFNTIARFKEAISLP